MLKSGLIISWLLISSLCKAQQEIFTCFLISKTMVRMIDNNWIVYFDKYRDHKYGAVMSKDLINRTDISDKISMPAGMRHGTVFIISKREIESFFK